VLLRDLVIARIRLTPLILGCHNKFMSEVSMVPESVTALVQEIPKPMKAPGVRVKPNPEANVDGAESGEKGKRFFSYVDNRLGEGVVNASNFGRELPPGRSAEYALEIKIASLQIIDKLGIDDSLFIDDKYSEAFLALSDSWAANENSSIPNEAERTFLIQFGRLLAGNKSSFNQEAFARREEGADKYFDDPSSELAKKDKAVFVRLMANVNLDKTAALEEKLGDFGEGSLLADVRVNLGITTVDQEKPFRVIVLNTRRESPKGEEKYWRDVVHEDMVGFGAYTTVNPDNKVPVIVISQEEYDDLGYDSGDPRKVESDLIGHEYAHTQRQMRLGAETVLGRIFDERMVVLASDGGLNHFDTAVVLKTMAEILGPNDPNFREEFRQAMLSPKDTENFFRFVSDKFGFRSMLMLLATQPKSYDEPYGIDNIPGVGFNVDSRISDLIKIVVDERSKIDRNAVDSYRARLSILDPQIARDIRDSHMLAKAFLPDNLESIVEARAKS